MQNLLLSPILISSGISLPWEQTSPFPDLMFLKDPYSFSGQDVPEKDIFLPGNDPEAEYRKTVNHSFLCTGITFITAFFLAGSIASCIPAAPEDSYLYFLKDFLAGSIFFLPVAIIAIITRIYGSKHSGNSKIDRQKFLPLQFF